jgi:hypothetical protein
VQQGLFAHGCGISFHRSLKKGVSNSMVYEERLGVSLWRQKINFVLSGYGHDFSRIS